MKVLFIHNNYRDFGGEDVSVKSISGLLKSKGHEVKLYLRNSNDIKSSWHAFRSSFKNKESLKDLETILDEFKPHIVQIQNVYPLISLAAVKLIKSKGYPIVMRCPNYRLFCPSGLFLDTKGKVCEKCTGSLGEFWGVFKNCESNLAKSSAYSIRNAYARKTKVFFDHVDKFIVQSSFQKEKFASLGIPENRLVIVPGLSTESHDQNIDTGDQVVFIGRIDSSKGIHEFLEAAKNLPDIPFSIAGKIEPHHQKLIEKSSSNIKWVGFVKGEELDRLYHKAKIIVVPSKWYEGFPNVITKGMFCKKPIITTNIGAMKSIIDHNVNGILVEPGSSVKLAEAINRLYNDEVKCLSLGQKAYEKASASYSTDAIYRTLLATYQELNNSQ